MKLQHLNEVREYSFEALEESFNAYFEKQSLEEAWFKFNDDEKSLIKRVWNALKTRDLGALWDGSVDQLKHKNGVYQVDSFFSRESKANIRSGLKLIHNLVLSIGVVAIMLAVAIGGSMMVAGGTFWAFQLFMTAATGGGGSIAVTLAGLGLGSAMTAMTMEVEKDLRRFLENDFHVIVAPEILKIYSNFGELKRVVMRMLRQVKRKLGRPGKAIDTIKSYEPKSGWQDKYDSTGVIDYEATA